MTTQPEALRLADWLEDQYDPTYNQEQAAAELRRLHDENKILHQFHHDANLEYTRILVQRDALLEALTRMAAIIDKMGDMPDVFIHPIPWRKLKCEEALAEARAAIALVEGRVKAVEEGK